MTRKRMETADDEFVASALDFIDRAVKADKPFFTWVTGTRMHIHTRLKEESRGVTGIGLYPDGMVEHDGAVGLVLDKLDELGIANNTMVMYSTDNGAETFTWPDGGITPFHGEKGTTWEGGFRAPCMIRWPGVIEPGTVSNDIFSHEDMMPTILAAAGVPDVKEKLLTGYEANGKTFKAHLDGFLREHGGRVSANHDFNVRQPHFLFYSTNPVLMWLRDCFQHNAQRQLSGICSAESTFKIQVLG